MILMDQWMTKSVVSCLRQPIVLRSDHRSRTTPCHSSRARFMNRLQSWLYSVWRQQSECPNDSKVYSDFVRPWWSCLILHWDLPQTKKNIKSELLKEKGPLDLHPVVLAGHMPAPAGSASAPSHCPQRCSAPAGPEELAVPD